MTHPAELSLTTAPGPSNLAFALWWLPRSRRRDALLFYRFCRTIDDIADDAARSAAEKEDQLGQWLEAVETGLPREMEHLVDCHGIDRRLLREIIKGCASDIVPRTFQTITDLEDYCWQVACAVGLVSIRIFGCVDSGSERCAEHLGHALQLTNIIRDVEEDAHLGRVYLPLDDLARHGLDADRVLASQAGEALAPVLAIQAGRARARFAAAQVPPADFKAMLPARIMRAVYEKTLSNIEISGFSIPLKNARPGTPTKIACALSAYLERPKFSGLDAKGIPSDPISPWTNP